MRGPSGHRYRSLVERFFKKLKHYRAVATRYEKRAANYLVLVKLAAIRIWFRHNESVTSTNPMPVLELWAG